MKGGFNDMFNWLKKDSKQKHSKNYFVDNKKQQIYDPYGLFANVLDNTLKFIDAYLEEMPNEWILMFINEPPSKVTKHSPDYWCYEEFIEIKIAVGSWYNGILYKNKDLEDYMLSVYEFDPEEKEFIYKIQIAESTNCIIDDNLLVKKLFEYLDTYEKSNPERKLKRTERGVHHQWNL